MIQDGITLGCFPKPKPRLNNVGKKHGLAMENLTEDELSTTETNRKERGILQDAKLCLLVSNVQKMLLSILIMTFQSVEVK